MSIQRQFQEAVARCVSIMVFYHNSERTPDSLGLMRSEIREVAGLIAALARPDEDPYQVDLPVEGELMARYGHEVGPRLFADFRDALGAAVPARIATPGATTSRGRTSAGNAEEPLPRRSPCPPPRPGGPIGSARSRATGSATSSMAAR
jgi:hypothetical protein